MEYSSYWQELGVNDLQQKLAEIFPEVELNLGDILKYLLRADLFGALREIFRQIKTCALQTFMSYKEILVWLLTIGILTALVTRFVELFDMKQVAELSFCFLYFTIAFVLLKIFGESLTIAREALRSIVVFIKLMLPAYMLSIGLSIGNLSAGLANQILVLGIYVVEQFAAAFLLPAVYALALLLTANGIWAEEKLTLLVKLLEKGIKVVLRGLLWLMTGITFFQSMISPLMDTAKNTVLEKVVTALPGIGNAAEGAFELVVGSAVFMKRCLGSALMLFLLIICITPLIKLGITVLVLKAGAALVGTVSDRRIAETVNKYGDVCGLLWQMVGIAMLLFLVALAVTTAAARG